MYFVYYFVIAFVLYALANIIIGVIDFEFDVGDPIGLFIGCMFWCLTLPAILIISFIWFFAVIFIKLGKLLRGKVNGNSCF